MGVFDSAELAHKKLKEEIAKLEKRNQQLTEKVMNMQAQITDQRIAYDQLARKVKWLEKIHEGLEEDA